MASSARGKQGVFQKQQKQQRDVAHGEPEKIPLLLFGEFPGQLLVGDQACHGGNQRPEAAEIGADQQAAPVRREAGKQQRGWHVADDLAGEHGDGDDVARQNAGEEVLEARDGRQVADEDEERGEGAEQRVVHGPQQLPVPEQERGEDHRRDGEVGHEVEDAQQAQKQAGGAPREAFCAARAGFHGERRDRPGPAQKHRATQAEGGVLFLSVNPEVAISYDADGLVTAVEARNDDGSKLLEGYTGYVGKPARQVVSELVTAIGEAGYFAEEIEGENRQIVIEIETGSALPDDAFLEEIITDVRSCVSSHNWSSPVDMRGESDYGMTDYVDTDYGPDNDGVTDYNDTDYGPNNDGVTNYDDTDYGPNNDGVTNYDDTDYGPNNDGVTNYDDTDYGPNNDGVTNYDDTDYGPNNDGVTNYDDTDYGPNNDGVTNYDDTDYGPNNDGVTNYDDTDYGPNNDGVTDYSSGDTNYDDGGDTDYGDDDDDDDDDD